MAKNSSAILHFYQLNQRLRLKVNGGWGGIRTPGGLAPSSVFKTDALNRTLPPIQKCAIRFVQGSKYILPLCFASDFMGFT